MAQKLPRNRRTLLSRLTKYWHSNVSERMRSSNRKLNARELERVLWVEADTMKPGWEEALSGEAAAHPQDLSRPGPWAKTFADMALESSLLV